MLAWLPRLGQSLSSQPGSHFALVPWIQAPAAVMGIEETKQTQGFPSTPTLQIDIGISIPSGA